MKTPIQALADEWWENQRAGRRRKRSESSADWFGNDDRVTDLLDAGGLLALDFVDALLGEEVTEEDASRVGAGPLEDLIHLHGNDLADAIDERARRKPVFARAMRSVWVADGALNAAAAERLGRWLP